MDGYTHHHVYLPTIDLLIQALTEAGKQRETRRHSTQGQPAWLHHERQVMFEQTNILRARRGLAPVTNEDIEAADRRATGADWARKFAMYCADLVCADLIDDDHRISTRLDRV